MNERIIVTGAAGFVGRNIVAALNRRGQDNLVLVDDLGTSDKWRNLRGLEFERILPIDALSAFLASPDAEAVSAILHMGACSATTERDADYLLSNNYQYSVDLITWALAHGARMIYASSGATYGDGARGYSDRDEVTPTLRPLNMYGYSKHLVDLWAERNGLLNCGTSRATTWIELATALFTALGVDPRIEFVEMPESIRDRYQYFTEADGTRLREAGYRRPFRGVEDGVREYVETFLSQEL